MGNRFSKYAGGDLPPLFKPEVGESRTGKLESVSEWVSRDGDEFPVLNMVDPRTGEPFAYRASPWRARVCLDELDPPDGAVLKIERLPDIGQSHDVRITFDGVDAEEPPY
jgi:hypothetical protein